MPKRLLIDPRYDFRQGLNTAVSPDLLNASELFQASNARIDAVYGGFTKRTGTRRLHPTANGSPSAMNSVIQWDYSGGKQLVAIGANGKLYHKTSALGDFTEVSPGTAYANTAHSMVPFRSTSSGAALILYISGSGLHKWTGAAESLLTPTGLPTDIDRLAAHATRMFARSTNFPKTLYWSKVGDSETWEATGLPTDGGAAPVNVLNGESINSLEIIGSSLLIGSEDSISRFTGSSTDNIQLATDTLGLSGEVGPTGIYAMKRFENVAAIVSERGPYIVSESGIAPIGIKVEPSFLSIAPAYLPNATIGYHRGRKEIWFALSGTSDSGLNKTVYVYSTRLQAWMGPWSYGFGINQFARYEDSNGAENLVAACSDGFVRLMDDVGSYLDDRLSDGTGGSAISLTVEPVPHFFEVGAQAVKTLAGMNLDADITEDSTITIEHEMDGLKRTETIASIAYTNLAKHSEDLSQAAVWTIGGTTVVANNIAGPSGKTNGSKITTDNAGTTNLFQPIVITGTSVNYKLKLKAGTAGTSLNVIGVYNSTLATNLLLITLASDFFTTGKFTYVTGSSGVTTRVLDNGWVEIVFSISSGITSGNTLNFYPGVPTSATQYTYATEVQVTRGADEEDYIQSGATAAVSGILTYRIDLHNQGKRGVVRFKDTSIYAPSILGYTLEAYDMRRK